MDVTQLCEAVMIVLFGVSWPFNIAKSWKSKTAKGKSLMFEIIVIVGYLVGIYGKYNTYKLTGSLPYPTYFYILDIVMVTVDLILTLRNKALDGMEMHRVRKDIDRQKREKEKAAQPSESVSTAPAESAAQTPADHSGDPQ